MKIDKISRNIVITGASGWLGKRLADTLIGQNNELINDNIIKPNKLILLAPPSELNEKNEDSFKFVYLNDFFNLCKIM